MTPFVLRASSQYRPKAPYDVRSKKYAADFNEVKSLGRIDSTTRTDEQTQIALFWVEGSPQGWNRIARTVSAQQGVDLWENARLFGLLNLASADAYIADFENKYFYEFWRPITAIRAADTDGNPDTAADPTWDSLVPTPPAPDYPSGHSGQGGAMSEVLARFFGDGVSFSTTSTTQPGVTRSFTQLLAGRERERQLANLYRVPFPPRHRRGTQAWRQGRAGGIQPLSAPSALTARLSSMLEPAGVTVMPAGPTHDVATRCQRLRCVKSPLPIARALRVQARTGNVARLARERLADGIERREAERPRFAGRCSDFVIRSPI